MVVTGRLLTLLIILQDQSQTDVAILSMAIDNICLNPTYSNFQYSSVTLLPSKVQPEAMIHTRCLCVCLCTKIFHKAASNSSLICQLADVYFQLFCFSQHSSHGRTCSVYVHVYVPEIVIRNVIILEGSCLMTT